jgi:hypothetical protein
MRDSAHRIAADGFCAADLAHLKSMAAPLLWQRQSKHDTVSAFLESLWPRLAEPLCSIAWPAMSGTPQIT